MKRVLEENGMQLSPSKILQLPLETRQQNYYKHFVNNVFFPSLEFYNFEDGCEDGKKIDAILEKEYLIRSIDFTTILYCDIEQFNEFAKANPEITGFLLGAAAIANNIEMLSSLIESKLYKCMRPADQYQTDDFVLATQAAAARDNYQAFMYLVKALPQMGLKWHWIDQSFSPFSECNHIPHLFYYIAFYNTVPCEESVTYYRDCDIDFLEEGRYESAFYILKLGAADENAQLADLNDHSFTNYCKFAESALKACNITSIEHFHISEKNDLIVEKVKRNLYEALYCMTDVPNDICNILMNFMFLYGFNGNDKLITEWASSSVTDKEIEDAKVEGVEGMHLDAKELVARMNKAMTLTKELKALDISFLRS